ncbi:hypothetical protein BDV95DRAFT_61883 [Massariosphaeria phaeospora]|uniref:Uncharacterized protein n=1 Tax=Massariosphaeria phaeospora TaxID=100035 RepID=A0A7C8M8B4_9PLEO|nr:hypothetical protein BDV95DRAFT_61883 [Massariosphaeria phaeospora]
MWASSRMRVSLHYSRAATTVCPFAVRPPIGLLRHCICDTRAFGRAAPSTVSPRPATTRTRCCFRDAPRSQSKSRRRISPSTPVAFSKLGTPILCSSLHTSRCSPRGGFWSDLASLDLMEIKCSASRRPSARNTHHCATPAALCVCNNLLYMRNHESAPNAPCPLWRHRPHLVCGLYARQLQRSSRLTYLQPKACLAR